VARISPREIGVILNKVIEQKKQKNQKKNQEQLSLSTQAYKLFSDTKNQLEVSIPLNLKESVVTKFYKEYWKLKQLHNLNMVYEETKEDISPFLKLYRLSKAKGMGVKQVVDLLAIANNDLAAIEEQFKTLRNDLRILQFQNVRLWEIYIN
jgi:hypothetical protein